LRTSSAANVGSDKDSDKRQRAAIASFAKAHGYRIVDEFYDAAVSGADPVAGRPGCYGRGRNNAPSASVAPRGSAQPGWPAIADSRVGARICNGLGIMRACLETQKLVQVMPLERVRANNGEQACNFSWTMS